MICVVPELKKALLGLKRLVVKQITMWITLKTPPLSLRPTLEGGVAMYIGTYIPLLLVSLSFT